MYPGESGLGGYLEDFGAVAGAMKDPSVGDWGCGEDLPFDPVVSAGFRGDDDGGVAFDGVQHH